MVLMRVRNKEKRLISNTVRAMEQIFVFDPVSKTSVINVIAFVVSNVL